MDCTALNFAKEYGIMREPISIHDTRRWIAEMSTQGTHWPGKTGETRIVREFWKAQSRQGIVWEFYQRSGNFQFKADVLIFCTDMFPSRSGDKQGDDDSRRNIGPEKSCHFDMNFLWNSPGKPGIIREFHPTKWVGNLVHIVRFSVRKGV